VGDLRALAETMRPQRERAEAARARQAEERAERTRQRRLTKLASDLRPAWERLEELVASSAYEDPLNLAVDLRDLAARDAKSSDFAKRFEALRKRQLRRKGLFDRWKRSIQSPEW
jgi:hypothetical protein